MNDTQKPDAVADDVVVTMTYTLTVDGQVVDATEGDEAIDFLQGHQNIIPGLEKELYGLKIGESKRVVVEPDEGYGETDPEAVIDVPRDDFPEEIPLKPGINLEMRDEDGEIVDATIIAVESESVKLDFNHPLAGKQLVFKVEVVDLRPASAEEIDHGHVHDNDHHH